MILKSTVFLLFLINSALSDLIESSTTSTATASTSISDDGALYLTPYLKSGNYKEAQKRARVPLNCPDNCTSVESYSGYFTVNQYNANLHVWYFVAETDPINAPVVFYFDGGPHISVVPAVFSLTPFKINEKLELQCREEYWNQDYHLVFIEYPVTTGFSFTDCEDGYDKTHTDTGNTLYSAFQQFFEMFPHLQQNKIYIHSHSYGSLYTSHLGEKILNDTTHNFNLCGILFGNPFLEAIHQCDFADLPYHLGLLNLKEYRRLVERQNKLKRELMCGDYNAAFYSFTTTMLIPSLSGTFLGNLTGFSTPYNFLHTKYDDSYVKLVVKYVSQPDIRCALHVRPDLKFELENSHAFEYIRIYHRWITVVPQVYSLLKSNITVLIYNGDFDLYTPHRSISQVISHMPDYGPLYDEASRKKWYIRQEECMPDMIEQWGSCEDNLAGYITEVKKYGKLVHAYVRGGGHFVMFDQGIRVRSLLRLYMTNT